MRIFASDWRKGPTIGGARCSMTSRCCRRTPAKGRTSATGWSPSRCREAGNGWVAARSKNAIILAVKARSRRDVKRTCRDGTTILWVGNASNSFMEAATPKRTISRRRRNVWRNAKGLRRFKWKGKRREGGDKECRVGRKFLISIHIYHY